MKRLKSFCRSLFQSSPPVSTSALLVSTTTSPRSVEPQITIDSIHPCLLSKGTPNTLDRSLERIFGSGATQLAVKFEGGNSSTVDGGLSERSSEEDLRRGL